MLQVPRIGLGKAILGLQRGGAAAVRGSAPHRVGCWHRWQSKAFAESWTEAGAGAWSPASRLYVPSEPG